MSNDSIQVRVLFVVCCSTNHELNNQIDNAWSEFSTTRNARLSPIIIINEITPSKQLQHYPRTVINIHIQQLWIRLCLLDESYSVGLGNKTKLTWIELHVWKYQLIMISSCEIQNWLCCRNVDLLLQINNANIQYSIPLSIPSVQDL